MKSITESEGARGLPKKDGQGGNSLTHEGLVEIVGSDYQEILHTRLYERGILKEGERLEFNFPDPHKGSDANYLYEGTIGNDWVFIYVLLPNGTTSPHKHRHKIIEVTEEYHLLRGRMNLNLRIGDYVNYTEELDEENNSKTVFPGIQHRGSTNEHFAFVLVVMPNAAPIPRDQLHLPV